jgi:hypothetical protein
MRATTTNTSGHLPNRAPQLRVRDAKSDRGVHDVDLRANELRLSLEQGRCVDDAGLELLARDTIAFPGRSEPEPRRFHGRMRRQHPVVPLRDLDPNRVLKRDDIGMGAL